MKAPLAEFLELAEQGAPSSDLLAVIERARGSEFSALELLNMVQEMRRHARDVENIAMTRLTLQPAADASRLPSSN